MFSRFRFAFAIVFAFSCGTVAARAQVAVYAMGSGSFIGAKDASVGSLVLHENGFSAGGGTFGVYDDFLRLGPVKLGADARYFQASSSNTVPSSNRIKGGFGGLRLAFKLPIIPFKPYVQGEVGGVDTNYGYFANETSSFGYQVQAGLDYTIIPHLDARFEYGGGQFKGQYGQGTQQTLQQVGAGLVLRFF